MSSPTPVQSFIGGVGLSLPVHALLLLNGNVFGISGFLHRAVLGGKESVCAVLGLVLGGSYIGLLEGHGPSPLQIGLGRAALAGFLVGFGSKSYDMWIVALLFSVTTARSSDKNEASRRESPLNSRLLVFLATGFEFALALRFSNLSEPIRVSSFLKLPFHPSFDPSLAFLAAGALPTSTILYQFFRGSEKPLLGGKWSIPKGGPIDIKLIGGAALFGIGWGLAGICPGPGLVNLGRAITGGSGIVPVATWLSGVVLGGLCA
ncbi:hypothetical protein H0H92_000030 [Tricholoma furcatifolium]|nr:hypothetical protein H0H92_000030 [Tricholoma furcatifolium]